jgi:selenocysteine-specific elongation factor
MRPPPQPLIVATAGHIDHGKSTLVEALTGTDPDRLPEEKRRGMTIELGFAHLTLADPTGPHDWDLGLVDVPGHADFVRNMVAGVGKIDAALLVVASDDGWMPQTEEHFRVLQYLGVTRGVVAVTKSDLLRGPEVCDSIRSKLQGTPWADAPLVPVCALGGEGLDDLRAALTTVLRSLPLPANIGRPRLHVDRAFSPTGSGTVVTGTLSGGELTVGVDITVMPIAEGAKIRGLQQHGKSRPTVVPGMRVAVQLGGVTLAKDGTVGGIARGHTLAFGQREDAGNVVHVAFQVLDRGTHDRPEPVLRHGQRVWFHHGTASVEARAYLAAGKTVGPGTMMVGELRCKEPVFLYAHDRFVLRDFSRRHTLAGGLVLDPQAKARAWRKAPVQAALQAMAESPEDIQTWLRGQLTCHGVLRRSDALRRSHFSSAAVAQGLKELGDLTVAGDFLLTAELWASLSAKATDLIRSYHKQHPREQGMPLAGLRTALGKALPHPAFFEVILDRLVAEGWVRGAGTIRDASFVVAVSGELGAAMEKVRHVLRADPLNPPKSSTFVASEHDKQAIKLLLQSGDVIALDEETLMLAAAAADLQSLITQFLLSRGKATVADLRDATQSTRRILIPFCERLDRRKVTVRNGDVRTLSVATREAMTT